jgi:hypothetical protein
MFQALFTYDSLVTVKMVEIIQRRLVERFTKILLHSQSLQLGHLDNLKSRINGVELALGKVDPAKDQDLFIEHNLRPFSVPGDWVFEPCATHYDTVGSFYLSDHQIADSDVISERDEH